MKRKQYEAKLEEKYEVRRKCENRHGGGALKRRNGLLCDNLQNLPERKASRRTHVENHSCGPETKPLLREELVRRGAQRNFRNPQDPRLKRCDGRH